MKCPRCLSKPWAHVARSGVNHGWWEKQVLTLKESFWSLQPMLQSRCGRVAGLHGTHGVLHGIEVAISRLDNLLFMLHHLRRAIWIWKGLEWSWYELMSLVHSFDSTDLRRFGSYDYTPSIPFYEFTTVPYITIIFTYYVSWYLYQFVYLVFPRPIMQKVIWCLPVQHLVTSNNYPNAVWSWSNAKLLSFHMTHGATSSGGACDAGFPAGLIVILIGFLMAMAFHWAYYLLYHLSILYHI